MRDLYGRLWARIESDLLAYTVGRDYDPNVGEGPLLRLIQSNYTIGHFVVCHDTDSLPRIVVRRPSARFDPRRHAFAQTEGVSRWTLATEAATLSHEHGHFQQWHEDQLRYGAICVSYGRLNKTGYITRDDARIIIKQEWDAWMRGLRTLRGLNIKTLDMIVVLWRAWTAFQSYLWIVFNIASVQKTLEKNKTP